VNQRHEYILVFRKYVSEDYHKQRDRPAIGDERREASKLTAEEWREFAQSVWGFLVRVRRWRPIIPQRSRLIARRLIALYSFAGDLVLDPFVGIGTSAVAPSRRDGTTSESTDQSRTSTQHGGGEGVSDDTEGEIAKSPSPSDDIAQYIVDGLERQEPTTLRKIGDYANELASTVNSSPRTNSKSGQTTVNRSPV